MPSAFPRAFAHPTSRCSWIMEMTVQAILLPLLAQVVLTFALLGLTGYSRVASVRRGETKVRDIALGQLNWPEHITTIGNSYNNQFQLPVLFYVVVILAYVLRTADLLFVVLSWLFVATRLGHAYIHVSSNRVGWRFNAFAAGFAVLVVMWIVFAVRILIGPQ
jgi:hypothetical protein